MNTSVSHILNQEKQQYISIISVDILVYKLTLFEKSHEYSHITSSYFSICIYYINNIPTLFVNGILITDKQSFFLVEVENLHRNEVLCKVFKIL